MEYIGRIGSREQNLKSLTITGFLANSMVYIVEFTIHMQHPQPFRVTHIGTSYGPIHDTHQASRHLLRLLRILRDDRS